MNHPATFHSQKAQSTVEYILLVTAVLMVGLFFVMGTITHDKQRNITGLTYSGYQEKLNQTYSSGAAGMQGSTQRVFASMANSAAVNNPQ